MPTPAEATPSPSPTPNATAASPAEVPKAQQFKLDDVAEFDDGLLIEIAGTDADKATKTDRGAEATKGQIVIASVRIENKTKKSYSAEGVLIGAKYGDGKDEGIATVGFAVPWKELKKVTFIVDPNDDVHEAISFTGQVHRD